MRHGQLPARRDLHVVLAYLDDPDGRYLGLTAVTGPVDYAEAQKRRREFEAGKRHNSQAAHKGRIRGYLVRSLADPTVDGLITGPFFDARSKRDPNLRGHDSAEAKAAKAWGDERGYSGGVGGWIYDSVGEPVIQGWASFAFMLRQQGRIAAGANRSWWILGAAR